MRHFWVDRITSLEPHAFAEGVKCVALAEDAFTDHFPGNPVFPGIYILEGLAQTGGVLLEESCGGAKFALMASVDRARFSSFARPGDSIRYRVDLEALTDDAARVRCSATVDGRTVADARISYRLVPTERVIPPLSQPYWQHMKRVWRGDYPELTDV